jgi:hypothetical protein
MIHHSCFGMAVLCAVMPLEFGMFVSYPICWKHVVQLEGSDQCCYVDVRDSSERQFVVMYLSKVPCWKHLVQHGDKVCKLYYFLAASNHSGCG